MLFPVLRETRKEPGARPGALEALHQSLFILTHRAGFNEHDLVFAASSADHECPVCTQASPALTAAVSVTV